MSLHDNFGWTVAGYAYKIFKYSIYGAIIISFMNTSYCANTTNDTMNYLGIWGSHNVKPAKPVKQAKHK